MKNSKLIKLTLLKKIEEIKKKALEMESKVKQNEEIQSNGNGLYLLKKRKWLLKLIKL